MAACTHAAGTADTGNTPNTSGAFVPVNGDLLIAFVVASDTVSATATLTSSVGLTFTQFLKAAFRGGVDSIYGFVANALVSNTASQTVTFDAADAATGTIIFVCRVSGMTKTGLTAVRQSAKQDNQGVGTPAPAFSASALTGNPTLGVIGNSTASLALTPPTGWTEPAGGETSYTTPSTGGEYVFRDSGFTNSTITWGSASLSAFGSMIVELDTSVAAAVVPVILAQFSQRK